MILVLGVLLVFAWWFHQKNVFSPYPKGYYPVTGLTFLPQFV